MTPTVAVRSSGHQPKRGEATAERKPKQQKPAAKGRQEKDAKKRAKDLDLPGEKAAQVKGGRLPGAQSAGSTLET